MEYMLISIQNYQKKPDAHVNSSEKMTISEKEHTIQYW